MNRRHAALTALLLAVALVAGMFATLRTTQLGATSAAPKVTAAQIAQRNRQLDAIEAKLRLQARRKPPALPALPALPAASPQAAAPRQPQRVVYVRPKPVVEVVHRSHGDEGHGEHDTEHGGGELDD